MRVCEPGIGEDGESIANGEILSAPHLAEANFQHGASRGCALDRANQAGECIEGKMTMADKLVGHLA